MIDFENNPQASVSNGRRSSGKTDWKADAYLNLYLPSADPEDAEGIKIGYVALKGTKDVDAQLIEMIQKSTPEELAKFFSRITVKANLAAEPRKLALI